jgi:hypothetical protein
MQHMAFTYRQPFGQSAITFLCHVWIVAVLGLLVLSLIAIASVMSVVQPARQ